MDKVGENKDLEKKATDQRSPAWPQAQVSRSGLVWLPLPLEEAWGSWTLLLVPRALASQLETPASAPVSPAVCVCLSLILPTPLLYETGGTAPPPHLLPLLHPSFLIWKKHPVIRIPKRLPLLFHVTGAGAAGGGVGRWRDRPQRRLLPPGLCTACPGPLRCPPWPQLHKYLRTLQGLEDLNWVGARTVTPVHMPTGTTRGNTQAHTQLVYPDTSTPGHPQRCSCL